MPLAVEERILLAHDIDSSQEYNIGVKDNKGSGAIGGSNIGGGAIGCLDTNGVNTKGDKTMDMGMRIGHMDCTVLSPSSGCLLVGDRQSGKTTIAQAAALHFQQCPRTLIHTEVLECRSLVGQPLATVLTAITTAIARAKQSTPSLLLLDDLDVICPAPTEDGGQANVQSALISWYVEGALAGIHQQATQAFHRALHALRAAQSNAQSNSQSNSHMLTHAVTHILQSTVYVLVTANSVDSIYPRLRSHGVHGCLRHLVTIQSLNARTRVGVLRRALRYYGCPLITGGATVATTTTITKMVVTAASTTMSTNEYNAAAAAVDTLTISNSNNNHHNHNDTNNDDGNNNDDGKNNNGKNNDGNNNGKNNEGNNNDGNDNDEEAVALLASLTEGCRPGDLWTLARKVLSAAVRKQANHQHRNNNEFNKQNLTIISSASSSSASSSSSSSSSSSPPWLHCTLTDLIKLARSFAPLSCAATTSSNRGKGSGSGKTTLYITDTPPPSSYLIIYTLSNNIQSIYTLSDTTC